MKLAFLIMAALVNPVFAGELIQTNHSKSSGPLVVSSYPPVLDFPAGGMPFDARLLSGSPPVSLKPGIRAVSPDASQRRIFPGIYGLNGLRSYSTRSPVPGFKTGKTPPAGKLPLASPAAGLKPGVYRTLPYTCIVIVPGPHPDDVSAVESGTDGVEKLPVFKPGLKFVPLAPAAGAAGQGE
jgi:hypothetical protein